MEKCLCLLAIFAVSQIFLIPMGFMWKGEGPYWLGYLKGWGLQACCFTLMYILELIKRKIQ